MSVPNGHEAVRMHNVFPRFSETPGAIEWAGGELGQDNAAVFSELGLDDADLGRLRTTAPISERLLMVTSDTRATVRWRRAVPRRRLGRRQ